MSKEKKIGQIYAGIPKKKAAPRKAIMAVKKPMTNARAAKAAAGGAYFQKRKQI